MSRDFRPTFFHDSNPSRPLINRLKCFWIRLQFRWDIRIFKKLHGCASHCGVRLCGVHHTAEASNKYKKFLSQSVMKCSRNLFYFRSFSKTWSRKVLQIWKHEKTDIFKQVWLLSVHPTAESSSAVCFPPWSQAPLCLSHCVHHTAELNCTQRSQNQNLCESLVAF